MFVNNVTLPVENVLLQPVLLAHPAVIADISSTMLVFPLVLHLILQILLITSAKVATHNARTAHRFLTVFSVRADTTSTPVSVLLVALLGIMITLKAISVPLVQAIVSLAFTQPLSA